jgi:hypothetical protein
MTHIFNKFEQGDQVDYLIRASADVRQQLNQVNNSGIQGGLQFGSAAANAFQKAKEQAIGLRRRAVVDHIVDADTIRIMCCDNMEILWVSPNDLEALDAVSVLADAVTSKSLKAQLAEIEDAEGKPAEKPTE